MHHRYHMASQVLYSIEDIAWHRRWCCMAYASQYCVAWQVLRAIEGIALHHRYRIASQVLHGVIGIAWHGRYSIALHHKYCIASQVLHGIAGIVLHHWHCMASQVSHCITGITWHHRYCMASRYCITTLMSWQTMHQDWTEAKNRKAMDMIPHARSDLNMINTCFIWSELSCDIMLHGSKPFPLGQR